MSSLRSGCCRLYKMTALGDTSTTSTGSVYLRGGRQEEKIGDRGEERGEGRLRRE